jgi:hypothetical protein
MKSRSHYYYLTLADYVIAPSHYERFLRYGRNDKVGWGSVPLRRRKKNKVVEYLELVGLCTGLRSQIPRYALNDGWGWVVDGLLIWFRLLRNNSPRFFTTFENDKGCVACSNGNEARSI